MTKPEDGDDLLAIAHLHCAELHRYSRLAFCGAPFLSEVYRIACSRAESLLLTAKSAEGRILGFSLTTWNPPLWTTALHAAASACGIRNPRAYLFDAAKRLQSALFPSPSPLCDAEIVFVAVDREHRQEGIAKGLLLYTFRHLKTKGIREVCLQVFHDNYSAMRLYQGLGFVEAAKGPKRITMVLGDVTCKSGMRGSEADAGNP